MIVTVRLSDKKLGDRKKEGYERRMRPIHTVYLKVLRLSVNIVLILTLVSNCCMAQSTPTLKWRSLPPIPDELGLAGPVVGVHEEILIVGGGANFAKPVWENVKRWHDKLYALDLRNRDAHWQSLGQLPTRLAYSACASTPYGVAVIGGNDDQRESVKCYLLKTKRETDGRVTVDTQRLSDLPRPVVYGQAVWIADHLLVLSGQTGSALSTAISGGWQLKINDADQVEHQPWQSIVDCPGGPRAFAMTSVVPKSPTKLLLMGGRRQAGERVEFLSDVWQYDLSDRTWRQLASMPVPVTAGGAGVLKGYVAVISGDDGALFTQTEQLKDKHPGFAKRTWLFDIAAGRWLPGGPSPANQVTTPPITLADRLIIASGEVRPRVRTSQVWEVTAE